MTGHDGASAARGLVTNATAERQGDLPQTGRATMGVTPSTGARCAQRPGPPAPHEPAPREALHTNAMQQDHFLAQRQRNKTSRIFSPPTFFFFFCRRVNFQTLNKQTASLVWTIKQKGRDEPSQDGSMVAAERVGAGGGGRRDAESPRAGHTRRPESVRAKLTLSPQPAPPPSTALKTIETGEKVGRSAAA